MNWNLKLGRYFGIDVYLHVTFLLLLGLIGSAHWLAGRSAEAALGGVLFFCAIFLCVLLHEFGHALAARRFGIGTKDIVLLPIGGVARLERMPERPVQEFWIAVAGPAVNVVIGAALGLGLWLTGSFVPLRELSTTSGSFAERLLMVNVFLVLFNLLPAFPIDGGRVLRSLLALRLDFARATQIAGRIGQGMAVVFVLVGLLTNLMLLVIAVFVWLGATREMAAAGTRSALGGVRAREAMLTQYQALPPDATLGAATSLLLAGSQVDFPVISNRRVIGLLERRHLVDGLKRFGPNARVADVMAREFPTTWPEEPLTGLLSRLGDTEFNTIPVLSEDRLEGLLTMENLNEFLLVQSAVRIEPGGQANLRATLVPRPPPLPVGS